MSVDLHRLLGSLKFQSPLFESHLNLLSKDLAIICIMQCGVVPLVILYILELVEAPQALLDRLGVRQDIKGVLGDLPRNARHVRGAPFHTSPSIQAIKLLPQDVVHLLL